MSHAVEREIKLQFESPDAARTAVAAAGATLVHARRLQRDTLFDTPGGDLRRARTVVRIRTEPDGCRLTFKGPPEAGPMKVREEAETVVADERVLARVFDALDLRIAFRYEKFREEYSAPGVIVAIDETPVGTFVEVEGTEAGIRAMVAALGRGPDDFLVDSYSALFLARREQYGLTGPHMLFEPAS